MRCLQDHDDILFSSTVSLLSVYLNTFSQKPYFVSHFLSLTHPILPLLVGFVNSNDSKAVGAIRLLLVILRIDPSISSNFDADFFESFAIGLNENDIGIQFAICHFFLFYIENANQDELMLVTSLFIFGRIFEFLMIDDDQLIDKISQSLHIVIDFVSNFPKRRHSFLKQIQFVDPFGIIEECVVSHSEMINLKERKN
jgi:hypothetical protein